MKLISLKNFTGETILFILPKRICAIYVKATNMTTLVKKCMIFIQKKKKIDARDAKDLDKQVAKNNPTEYL